MFVRACCSRTGTLKCGLFWKWLLWKHCPCVWSLTSSVWRKESRKCLKEQHWQTALSAWFDIWYAQLKSKKLACRIHIWYVIFSGHFRLCWHLEMWFVHMCDHAPVDLLKHPTKNPYIIYFKNIFQGKSSGKTQTFINASLPSTVQNRNTHKKNI